jgi:hypothetical protein
LKPGRDLGIDFGLPGVRRGQVGEALVGAAEIRQVDQVDHRGEGREVRQRVLRALDRAALHRLRQRTAGTQLTTGGEAHIDLAVGHVLDVFLQVQLHDRVAARRAQHIGRGQRHDVIGRGLALTLFRGGLRRGLIGPDSTMWRGQPGCRRQRFRVVSIPLTG